jgi:nucleoside-diphosphate-sugar epimerase
MTSSILVTGGTGTLGQHVVRHLREAGCDVRVLSRSIREAEDGVRFVTGDLATGEGIEAAVDGIETIVHLAGSAKATRTRLGTWYRRRRGLVRRTWYTSR